MSLIHEWWQQVYREFSGYSTGVFQKDLLAALTVAAVALPLALAFGVASGASAAAGLVTAILAGIVIGFFSGAPYQISGPTGAMSAVLIVLANRYGLPALWLAGGLAGLMMLILAVFRLGRVVALIPTPVISGFTSGIAIIIAFGQLDNLLGMAPVHSENLVEKIGLYFQPGLQPNWQALVIALGVMAIMVGWPLTPVGKRVPGSLVGILAATGLTIALGWQVPIIGAIPRTILLAERLQISTIPWERLPDLVVPAMSIAALGAIESLLCGAVAGNMTGIRMANSVELAAQGIGNLLIPFFGGVPATAAIARTSVNVKSGGVTRMTSILHGVALLLVTYLLAPWMRAIPLSALAGVLMITAWRMNEWAAIQFYFGRRLRHAMAAFILTLAATVLLDLTQAIMIGFGISTLIFMAQISDLDIVREPVIADRLGANGRDYTHPEHPLAVYYVSGPMFFAAVRKLTDTVEQQDPANTTLILSLRGVPLIDATGVEVLRELIARQHEGQGRVLLAGLQPKVRMILERAGLLEEIGSDNIFWSSDRAILSLGGAAQAGEPEFGSSKLNDLDQAAQITPHENRKL